MDTQAQTEWLTYRRAQEYTSLSRTTLWGLISSGAIEAAHVGRAVRISRRSLDEYMHRNSNVAMSQQG
jgi:excisionase family DNA binding protein